MRASTPRRLDHLLGRGSGKTGDVLGYGAGQQFGILRQVADAATEDRRVPVPERHAVDPHLAHGRRGGADQHRGERHFPAPEGPLTASAVPGSSAKDTPRSTARPASRECSVTASTASAPVSRAGVIARSGRGAACSRGSSCCSELTAATIWRQLPASPSIDASARDARIEAAKMMPTRDLVEQDQVDAGEQDRELHRLADALGERRHRAGAIMCPVAFDRGAKVRLPRVRDHRLAHPHRIDRRHHIERAIGTAARLARGLDRAARRVGREPLRRDRDQEQQHGAGHGDHAEPGVERQIGTRNTSTQGRSRQDVRDGLDQLAQAEESPVPAPPRTTARGGRGPWRPGRPSCRRRARGSGGGAQSAGCA